MQTTNKSRAFTRPDKWVHIGRKSTNGGMFPVFKRVLRKTSNKKQRAYTPDRDLYAHSAEHNQYVTDLFGSVQTALDAFNDARYDTYISDAEYAAEAESVDPYDLYDPIVPAYYAKAPIESLLLEHDGDSVWTLTRTYGWTDWPEREAAITLDRAEQQWLIQLAYEAEPLVFPMMEMSADGAIALARTLIRFGE